MPNLYCQQCFPGGQAVSLPEFSSNAFNHLNCINPEHPCGPVISQSSSMRSNSSENIQLKKLKLSQVDAVLSQWVNSAENKEDKANRIQLACALKMAGATLHRDQILVANKIIATDLSQLTSLPDNLLIKGDLNLSGASALKQLPQKLTVSGSLILQDCEKLEGYPDSISVGKDVDLSHCYRLTRLPENYIFKRDLILYKCTALKELPEKMTVGDRFGLKGCTQLNRLPVHLSVGGTLDMMNCIRVQRLPKHLVLGRNLSLENCQLLRELPEYVYELGHINTGSGQNNRTINLRGTFLSDEDIQRVQHESIPGIRFKTGPSRHPISVKVITEPGHEAEDILKYIKGNSKEDIYVQYKNQKGIDIGGLTRQALENAFEQLLNKKDGLFYKDKEGLYSLASYEFSDARHKALLDESNNIGALLSKMLFMGISTGHRFKPDFYQNLFDASRYFTELPKMSEQDFLIKIHDNFINVIRPEETITEMSKALPLLYGEKSKIYYLNTLDRNELKELALDIWSYMGIVGLLMLVAPDFDTVEELTEIIAGPQNTTQRFCDSLVVKTAEPENAVMSQMLVDWSKEALQKSNPQQIRDLVKDLTGASHFSSVKLDITLNLTCFPAMEKEILFKSHSCAFQLDVNKDIFTTLVSGHKKSEFIDAFLNSSSDRFNDA